MLLWRKYRTGKKLLGSLNNYLKETLNLILKKGKISAKELSAIMKLDIQEFQTIVPPP